MNKHFEDAWYYLGRAADHLRIGLEEELEPVATAVRERFGWEDEGTETRTRFDRVRTVGTEPVQKARERIDAYRERSPAE